MNRLVLRDTIANRILLGNVLLIACAVVATTFTATLLLRTYLYQRIDDQLRAVAEAPDVGPVAGQVPQPCDDESSTEAVLPSDFTLLLLEADGHVVCRIGTDLAGPTVPGPAALADLAGSGELFTAEADGGSAWRATVISPPEVGGAEPGTDGDITYAVVALSLDESIAIVRRLTVTGVLVGLVVIALVALSSRALVRMGLRPLTRIREATRAIAAGDLTARVPQDIRVAEAAELSAALNTMLTEVERAFAREQEASAQVRRFAADASHELRTPLTSIVGYAQLFRQVGAAHDDESAQVIDRIEAEAQRMSGIVADLLLLARLDREPVLELELVDLLEIAHDAIADARARQPGRPLVLHVLNQREGAPWQPPPMLVRGDDNALRQVVGNLVSNALDHTPTTSAVELRVGRTADSVVLQVHDAGPGMSPEVRDQVFERFFRGDVSRTRGTGGSGLGLAIVAALVHAHHGAIRCESAPEAGSTFTAVFPAAADPATGVRDRGGPSS